MGLGKELGLEQQKPRDLNAVYKEFIDNAPVGLGIGIAYESMVGPIRFRGDVF